MYSEEEVREFYATSTHLYGLDSSPIRDKLREYLISLNGKSYFEFGCNCGANLFAIRDRIGAEVEGIDINAEAIRYGRDNMKLDIVQGDEKSLRGILPIHNFDVCFTSSVLNHMVHVDGIIKSLKNMGKRVVLMEARVTQEPDFWSHDYESYGFKKVWDIFSPTSIGGHDVLYECFIWES